MIAFIAILHLPANLQALPQVKYLVTTNPSKLQFGNVQVGNTANLYETITNVGHVNINGRWPRLPEQVSATAA